MPRLQDRTRLRLRGEPVAKYTERYSGRTALYRFYDSAGRLLYVGITGNPEERWYEHQLTQYWWREVTRKELVWLETRVEARAAESAAIRMEKPLYDRSDRRARLPEQERRARSAEYVTQAVQAIEQDIRAEVFPLGSVLPSRPLLADRYGLTIDAVSSALWRLHRPGRLVTQMGSHWIVQDPGTFPDALARKYGTVYVLGVQAFGHEPFTKAQVQERTRLPRAFVGQSLRDLRRAGMAEMVGRVSGREAELWVLLPEPPPAPQSREPLEPEIGL